MHKCECDICTEDCNCALCMTDDERSRSYLTILKEGELYVVVLLQLIINYNSSSEIKLIERGGSHKNIFEAKAEAACWAAAEAIKLKE